MKNHDFMSQFSLKGKTALVTGAARGLGKVMASALGQAGANLVLADLQQELVDAAVNDLAQQAPACSGIVMDVTDETQVESGIRYAVERYGSLDIVINNAGILKRVEIENMEAADWEQVMSVNVTGVFLVSKHAARSMIQAKRPGSIINISSMSGIVVNTPMKQATYNTSKAAVAMLTKSCASEWAPHEIRVNAIAPGYMKTDMTGPEFEDGGVYRALLDLIPMNRLGLPEELGGLVIWLASAASSYVTGSVISIDGGYTIW